jgi:hypothetical protein
MSEDAPEVEVPAARVIHDRETLLRLVNNMCEVERLKYITPGDGMMLTYREKQYQAQALVALGQEAVEALTPEQAVAQYPTIAASVGYEAETLWDCAQLILSTYQQFALLSYAIERTRLVCKQAVSEAATDEAAQDVYDAIDWTFT